MKTDHKIIMPQLKGKKIKISDIILILSFLSLSSVVTFQQFTNEELKQESEILNRCLGAADAGRWLYKIDENKLIWDKGMFKLFNLQPKDNLVLKDFTDHLYIDDKQKIIDIMDEVIKNNSSYYAGYRAIGQDGELIEIEALGGMLDKNTFAGLCLPRAKFVSPLAGKSFKSEGSPLITNKNL